MSGHFSQYFTANAATTDAFDVSRQYYESDFRRTLENSGWAPCKSEKQNLLLSPDSQWIVKFYHPKKNAAEGEFARFVMDSPSAQQNSHFVRTAYKGEVHDAHFMVMENLQRLKITTRANDEALSAARTLFSPFEGDFESRQQAYESLRHATPEMLEALIDAQKHALWLSQRRPVLSGLWPQGVSAVLDGHHDNIMMRSNPDGPETIVFIDQFQMRPWPENTLIPKALKDTLEILGIDPDSVKRDYAPFAKEDTGERFSL